MLYRISTWLTFLGLLILSLTGLAVAAGDESEIPLNQVPKAVTDSAKAKYPGVTLREASKETEDGKTVYELEMTHKGQKMDATFEANGTLVVVEAEVAEKDVPAVVAKAVADKYPDAKVKLVESVMKGPELKTEPDYYEFHITTAAKKSVEVEVNSKGKILKSADAEEEEKEDKKDKD